MFLSVASPYSVVKAREWCRSAPRSLGVPGVRRGGNDLREPLLIHRNNVNLRMKGLPRPQQTRQECGLSCLRLEGILRSCPRLYLRSIGTLYKVEKILPRVSRYYPHDGVSVRGQQTAEAANGNRKVFEGASAQIMGTPGQCKSGGRGSQAHGLDEAHCPGHTRFV